jgi:hypothetical protein
MVYQEICGGLKRKGVRWKATAPQADGVLNKKNGESENASPSECGGWVMSNDAWKSCPRSSVNCAMMRTCRQLHAEFAAVLYGSPLELHKIARGRNVIPISPLYTGLVRAVFAVGVSGLDPNDCLDTWRTQLQVAVGLSGTFVNANTLRIGWFVAKPDEPFGNLAQQKPEGWDSAVKEVVKAIKTVKKISYTPLIVPHNLQVVQMYWTNGWTQDVQSIPSPVTEAIDMLRAKKPTRNARKTKH